MKTLMQVLEEYPDLTDDGFVTGQKRLQMKKHSPDWSPQESRERLKSNESGFLFCLEWLPRNLKRVKTLFNGGTDSETLTSWVGKDPDAPKRTPDDGCGYISEGALIAAVIALEYYPWRRDDFWGWIDVGVSRRSLKDVRYRLMFEQD